MKKKILILSTGDINGAYEAAYRVAKFADDEGFLVTLLVKKKARPDSFIVLVNSDEPTKIITRLLRLSKRLFLKFFFFQSKNNRPRTNPDYLFFDDDENGQFISAKKILSYLTFVPDIIISGMTNGFVNTNTLLELKKITNSNIYCWMPDMYPLTGGCHYAWDCEGYKLDCKKCPAILDKKEIDWPHKNFLIKQKNITSANIRVLGMSEWTVKQAKESALFREQEVFYNTNSCIDTDIFNAKNRVYAKQILDISTDAKTIFAGAQALGDKRKGGIYFLQALDLLWKEANKELKEKIIVLLAGRDKSQILSFSEKIPFKTKFIEYISDYRYLSLVYQASDVFVCPSIEDSGPMMVSEALACGTPVVGFDIGILTNMVQSGFNGYKVDLKNSEKLADGIRAILSLDPENYRTFSNNSIYQVEKYSSRRTVIDILHSL